MHRNFSYKCFVFQKVQFGIRKQTEQTSGEESERTAARTVCLTKKLTAKGHNKRLKQRNL